MQAGPVRHLRRAERQRMNRNDLISMAGQLRALLLENIKDVQVKFERVKGTEEDRELEFSFLITGEGATPNGGDVLRRPRLLTITSGTCIRGAFSARALIQLLKC